MFGMQSIRVIWCVICKVSVLYIALCAKCPGHALLYMQVSVLGSALYTKCPYYKSHDLVFLGQPLQHPRVPALCPTDNFQLKRSITLFCGFQPSRVPLLLQPRGCAQLAPRTTHRLAPPPAAHQRHARLHVEPRWYHGVQLSMLEERAVKL